jgi:hypothetical protein
MRRQMIDMEVIEPIQKEDSPRGSPILGSRYTFARKPQYLSEEDKHRKA